MHGANNDPLRALRWPAWVQSFFVGRKVGDILERKENNFDLLRLVAGAAVIVGHAFPISPRSGQMDPLLRLIHFDYSSGLAVAVFFFLSGLLVYESARRSRTIINFLAARVARILPGLAACLVVTIFLVGPLFTSLSVRAYFLNDATHSYYWKNILLTDLQWRLPGVFEKSALGVNGSLWSLPLEVRLYLVLGLVSLVGALRRAWTANLVLAAAVFAAQWHSWTRFTLLDQPEAVVPAASFVLGSFFGVNKNWLRLSPAILVLFAISLFFAWKTSAVRWIFYPAVFYSTLWCFSLPMVCRCRLRGDYSYGVYLYGFVVQQCVASLQTVPGAWVNIAWSLPVSVGLGALSWHFVEKPALPVLRSLPELAAIHPRNKVPAKRGFWAHASWPTLSVLFLAPLTMLLLPRAVPVQSDLVIRSFGPARVIAGQRFNIQPGGQSAIWVNVSRELVPGARLVLGGHVLESAPSHTVITALVPDYLYEKPGKLSLGVEEPGKDGPALSSGERTIEVISR